jgi:hypothetical protein
VCGYRASANLNDRHWALPVPVASWHTGTAVQWQRRRGICSPRLDMLSRVRFRPACTGTHTPARFLTLCLAAVVAILAWRLQLPPHSAAELGSTSIYNFSAVDIHGREIRLEDVAGSKVALIVNVASKCGFASLYTQLQSLYDRFNERGFVVLGFPCNQFGDQEPDDECEIEAFVSTQYHTTFRCFQRSTSMDLTRIRSGAISRQRNRGCSARRR